MTPPVNDLPRTIIAAIFMILFGYAIFQHYDDGLEQVLMNVILLLVGYWFGSSKGSADKSATIADLTTKDGG